jgi:hypothetical protein
MATAIASSEVVCYELTGRDFRALVEKNGVVGWKLLERSRDPECDAARALLAQGITGKLHLSDAGGFSIERKLEPWGFRYIYTPRPLMPRTIIDIEKAAMHRSVETANAPRRRD